MENNKKTFYIIGNYIRQDGLFAMYKHIISHVLYAQENGFIPIVDLQHYPNQYFKDGKAFKENTWEYYFEQPAGYSLKDIKQDSDVIIAHPKAWADDKYKIFPVDIKPEKTDILISPYVSEYINHMKFNDEVKIYLKENYKKFFNETDRVLGIICRGTDYIEREPKGHPIQPPIDDVIKKAFEVIKKYNYNKIYLATEDATIYKKFKDKFGDMLIENIQYKLGFVDKKLLCDVDVPRENHLYNLGKEYILSMYLLSKCKSLIGGRANGTLAAYLLTNAFKDYEYVYLWDLGKYGENNKFKDNIFSVKTFQRNGKMRKQITILFVKFSFKTK